MQREHPTYLRTVGWLVAILFLQAVLLKDLHPLLIHDHDGTLHCHPTDKQERHLHNEEYAPETCFVCVFHLAPASPADAVLLPAVPTHAKGASNFPTDGASIRKANWHFQRRGPPPSHS